MISRLPVAFTLLPVVTLSGAILGVSALGGIYTLSLENCSAKLSKEVVHVSDDLGREERQLQFTNAQIAGASSPEAIRRRVIEFKLPLAPARPEQTLSLGNQASTNSLLAKFRAGGLP